MLLLPHSRKVHEWSFYLGFHNILQRETHFNLKYVHHSDPEVTRENKVSLHHLAMLKLELEFVSATKHWSFQLNKRVI